jgi:hypothetical protein
MQAINDPGDWSLPQISTLPVLVTADFIWDTDAGESHFGPHRYRIDAYVFDPQNGKYLKKLSYATTKKYPGSDEADNIGALAAEKLAILARLPSR